MNRFPSEKIQSMNPTTTVMFYIELLFDALLVCLSRGVPTAGVPALPPRLFENFGFFWSIMFEKNRRPLPIFSTSGHPCVFQTDWFPAIDNNEDRGVPK